MDSTVQTVSRLEVNGKPAWEKRYGFENRAGRLGALAWVARRLHVPALLPPPHHGGDEARRVEQRRLGELKATGVHVPAVLDAREGRLVLGDMGETLAARLRSCEPEQSWALFAQAGEAIAVVHARGGYLGQPVPRNITVDDLGRIGFLDFEEDPGEVMSLPDAQTRDWLVFVAGVAKYLPPDQQRMDQLVAEAMRSVPEQTRHNVGEAAHRLGFLRPLTRWLGRRAGSLGRAVGSLQRALWMAGWLALAVGLGADLAHDGDVELIGLMIDLLD